MLFKKKKKKKEKWLKFRHKLIRSVAYCAIAPYCRWKYGITVD